MWEFPPNVCTPSNGGACTPSNGGACTPSFGVVVRVHPPLVWFGQICDKIRVFVCFGQICDKIRVFVCFGHPLWWFGHPLWWFGHPLWWFGYPLWFTGVWLPALVYRCVATRSGFEGLRVWLPALVLRGLGHKIVYFVHFCGLGHKMVYFCALLCGFGYPLWF